MLTILQDYSNSKRRELPRPTTFPPLLRMLATDAPSSIYKTQPLALVAKPDILAGGAVDVAAVGSCQPVEELPGEVPVVHLCLKQPGAAEDLVGAIGRAESNWS